MKKNRPLLQSIKGVFISLVLCGSFFSLLSFGAPSTDAVANSVLPSMGDEAGTEAYCEAIFEYGDPSLVQASFEEDSTKWNTLLACAIKMGKVKFWMIPYFVNYVLEFMINVAGVLVVLMIVIGGYYYIYGAVTDDKEKGKTIITYAVGGYVLVLSAWFIVNTLLLALTS